MAAIKLDVRNTNGVRIGEQPIADSQDIAGMVRTLFSVTPGIYSVTVPGFGIVTSPTDGVYQWLQDTYFKKGGVEELRAAIAEKG